MSDTTCAICATGLPVPVICNVCAAKIRRDLDTVGRLRAQLDPTPGRTGSAGRASGKPGSRPPANLTIIAMADIRSRFWLTDDGEADPDNVTNVDADLLTEARLVIEARRLNPPMRDVSDSLRILNIHLDWICSSDRVDEFAAVLAGCAHALRTVLHDWPETSVGRCTAAHPERDACGGPLRLAYDGQLPEDPGVAVAPTHIVCSWCTDVWPIDVSSLLGLLRVARPKAFPVSRAWACQVTGCNPDTLRQWIRRGHVTTYADEQVNLIDVLIRVSDTPGAGRMTSM